MEVHPITETKKAATEKWHEYAQAAKQNNSKMYSDLRRTYAQLKNGKAIIDIEKVLVSAGVHENFHPKLCITKAMNKKGRCHYMEDGTIKFCSHDEWPRPWTSKPFASDIYLKAAFPKITKDTVPSLPRELKLEAPVPIIPPHLIPNKLTDDFYILWEVDQWKPIPPVDPYLLRRITKNIFVIVAGWNLTKVEQLVMKEFL